MFSPVNSAGSSAPGVGIGPVTDAPGRALAPFNVGVTFQAENMSYSCRSGEACTPGLVIGEPAGSAMLDLHYRHTEPSPADVPMDPAVTFGFDFILAVQVTGSAHDVTLSAGVSTPTLSPVSVTVSPNTTFESNERPWHPTYRAAADATAVRKVTP